MSRAGDTNNLARTKDMLDYSSSFAVRMSNTKTDSETDSYINNIEDPITYEPIHKDRAVLIHKQLYDANSLSKYIESDINATIPHNREPFTEKMLRDIYNKSSCSKSDIIIELIILLKFSCSKEIQKIILSLEHEQRKILLGFPDYKIKILMRLSLINIDYLLTKYNYLLNTNITEEIIKEAVQEYYISLLLVPEDKMTEEIIKEAIKYNDYAFEFVPDDKKTDEIIKLAVRNYGFSLEYVPKDKMTDEIIKLAVQQNGYALQFVPKDKMTHTGDGYAHIGASSSGLDYSSSPAARMTDEICKLAVRKNGYALKYVPKDKMTDEICKLAVQNYGYALEFMPEDKMSEEICKLAVQKDGCALQYVPKDKITYEIIKLAVQKDGLALQYVPKDKMTHTGDAPICAYPSSSGLSDEIIKLAVQQNGYALQFVYNY
jgi:hypothetical protein